MQGNVYKMKKKEEENIESEIKKLRKFSLQSGISKEASGVFKGASVVPLVMQLETRLKQHLRENIDDPDGCIITILERLISDSGHVLTSYQSEPLLGLKVIIEKVLMNQSRLHEFVRQVDQQFGKSFQERPHFQQAGQEADPNDPYTHESVKLILQKLKEKCK